MKTKISFIGLLILFMMTISSASAHLNSPSSTLKEVSVSYVSDGVTLKGFVIYDESIKGKRPAVVIVPEWWGVNDYIKMRAHNRICLLNKYKTGEYRSWV
jgi:hypothetical protein